MPDVEKMALDLARELEHEQPPYGLRAFIEELTYRAMVPRWLAKERVMGLLFQGKLIHTREGYVLPGEAEQGGADD